MLNYIPKFWKLKGAMGKVTMTNGDDVPPETLRIFSVLEEILSEKGLLALLVSINLLMEVKFEPVQIMALLPEHCGQQYTVGQIHHGIEVVQTIRSTWGVKDRVLPIDPQQRLLVLLVLGRKSGESL